ncbi:DUF2989 domain-containing protein [Thaumasiovibrio subtropicus]|uniref:DUF2989 domain-containing protein n=1 Tax=Thaumasiovibrio subtropicus TaxID=1891207 RepID=UPI000B34D2CB|nr:DUF2989 domain-containing protein [Thaumasiovibrio subtropicus]
MKKYLITAALLLTACGEQHRTTESLCQANPEVCANLNNGDGQCRIQRTNLIWQRYDVKNDPTEQNVFKALKFTKEYQRCLELVAPIEPTELKERKTLRTDALIESYKEIERLMLMLSDSTDPEIIYYRWSHGDESAKQSFLALEGTPQLDTPALQLALASYYASFDKKRTQRILQRGLELVEGEENFEPDLIITLATMSHQLKQRYAAYTWSKVAQHFELPVANQARLEQLYPMPEEQYKYLNDVAKRIAKDLKRGHYRRSNYVLSPPTS